MLYLNNKRWKLHALAALIISLPAHAQEPIDYFDLSIEELLQIKTEVASIFPESKLEAPSAVTSFTQQEIQALGVTNLYELMNYVPGFQSVQGEFISSHLKLQSRGVYLDAGYVLVMKDGIRLNDVSFGKASVYTPHLDLANIAKVEVIRGPGSEQYGSNAFLGVVNLISAKTNEISFGADSDGLNRFSANLVRTNKLGEFSASFTAFNKDVEQNSSLYESAQIQGELNNNTEYRNLEVNWENKGLVARYKYDKHKQSGFVNLKGVHPDNHLETENHYLALNYHTAINDRWELLLDSNYAEHNIESAGLITYGTVPPFQYDFLLGPNWQTDNLLLSAAARFKYNESVNFKFGYEWQKARHTQAGVVTTHITPDYVTTSSLDTYYLGSVKTFNSLGDYASLINNVESQAVFGRVKWKISDSKQLNLGGRYEEYENENKVFSPRISYLQQLDNVSQLKLIYSKAYRSPVTNELFSDDSITLGNDELGLECIDTIEAQYLYHVNNWDIEVTGFYNKMDNLVVSVPLSDGSRTQFVNQGKETVYGLESLANYQIMQNLKVRATATYYLSDTIEHAYDHFATLAIMGKHNKFKYAINTVYRPKVTVNDGIRFATNEKMFDEGSHFVVNANVSYELGRSIEFNLAVNNLFDKQVFAYEPRQNTNQYRMPQPGQDVRLSMKYKF